MNKNNLIVSMAVAIFATLFSCKKDGNSDGAKNSQGIVKSSNTIQYDSRCMIVPHTLVCDFMNTPIVINDPTGCFCPGPCTNCMKEVVIKPRAVLTFVEAYNTNTLDQFFSTSMWREVFPIETVDDLFAQQIIDKKIKFIKKTGSNSNAGQDIYVAIPSNFNDTNFTTQDVVIALPINR